MVSAPLIPDSGTPTAEFHNLSKRKREEVEGEATFDKRSKAEESTKSLFDTELHLETPLPLEWERCLDIQSGQMHFYNTRTHRKTAGDPDPRRSSEPPSPGYMSLDLELNLPCNSQRKNQVSNNNFTTHNNSASRPRRLGDLFIDIITKEEKKSGDVSRCPSWLAPEGDQQEMVATACMRCHMLVILCKSSPTCPNCKFMHPADQSSPKLFKQKLGLFC